MSYVLPFNVMFISGGTQLLCELSRQLFVSMLVEPSWIALVAQFFKTLSRCCKVLNLFYSSCQFVVREGEDYEVHLVDADIPVDWNLIEQVVLKSAADVPSCPIW